MPPAKCDHCGAVLDGSVCKYCGSGVASTEALDRERRALDEFHAKLMSLGKKEQINLLKHGFMPDQTIVLIDAGLRCVAMLDDSAVDVSVPDAAAGRLEAIIMKLKLKPPDYEIEKAIARFSERLKDYKAQGNRNAIYGLTAIAVLTAIIAAAIWYILR
jgi:hypothetical protein